MLCKIKNENLNTQRHVQSDAKSGENLSSLKEFWSAGAIASSFWSRFPEHHYLPDAVEGVGGKARL